jgi:hypothetical protein
MYMLNNVFMFSIQLLHFIEYIQQYFSYVVAVSYIGGGSRIKDPEKTTDMSPEAECLAALSTKRYLRC